MALNISNSLLYSLCHGFRGFFATEYFLEIVFSEWMIGFIGLNS